MSDLKGKGPNFECNMRVGLQIHLDPSAPKERHAPYDKELLRLFPGLHRPSTKRLPPAIQRCSVFVLTKDSIMTAAQIDEMAAMSEAEIVALAYEEAAGGDVRRALQQAIEDVLILEARLAVAERQVSYGYVRGTSPAGSR
jgi:hypothetical protein